MIDLPYHHDWTPRFETSLGLRVKWFGRWREDPDWSIGPSRLATDLICFFYLEHGSCNLVINGVDVPLKPGDLAVLRGGDVFSASRLFKAHTGMPPKTWLIEARLQRATRLLTDPDATVEKVAGLCGFDCPYHFSRTFKRRFGIPPASYRRVRQVRGFVEP